MGGSGEPHPDPSRLTALVSGSLDETEEAEIERHLSQCLDCRQALEGAGLSAAPTAASLSPAPPASPEVPADLIDHPRYRISGTIGAGGMGAVYKAEHRLMERPVALKVISQKLTEHPAAVERFRREVKAAARLSHPNIVTAYDAEHAGQTHFLVMEFVEGITLARLIAQQGPLPVATACDYVRQVALGLEHAFERGMVHRDIKPQNLMLTPQGQVKILDFGLARFASEIGPATSLTDSGDLMGTADYIAPEQVRDPHLADTRSDIYGLGCTLYHLLAGHPPFPDGTCVQKLVAHLERLPRSLTEVRTDIPRGFVQVVERMMAKDPADRYQTPRQVVDVLAPFVIATVSPPTRGVEPIAGPMVGRGKTTAAPEVHNPFGVSDVHDPDGEDVQVFAAQAALQGGASDENAAEWCEDAVEGKPESLDGHWASRWIGGTARGKWVAGVATLKTVGDRVYILHTDATDTFLIDSRLQGGHRLVGRYVNLGDPADSTPWVGLIVDQQRIDGQWAHGRWDLRRKLRGATDRLTLRGHKGQVLCLAFSPDGQTLATGSSDQSVKLWDVPRGVERRTLGGHTAAVRCVAFGPDGKTLASGGGYDQLVKLWDVVGGAERHLLAGHAGLIYSVAFASDALTLASASEDHSVRLWDAATGQERRTLLGHADSVRCVAFSPNGRALASAGNDHTVRLWDALTGELLCLLAGHSDRVLSVAFSPDGEFLISGGNDQSVRVWDVATGQERRRFMGHAGVVFSVALSPDGRIAAAGSNTLQMWDVATGALRHTLRGHTAPVACVAFSPDGRRLASGSVDYTVVLWDLEKLAG